MLDYIEKFEVKKSIASFQIDLVSLDNFIGLEVACSVVDGILAHQVHRVVLL